MCSVCCTGSSFIINLSNAICKGNYFQNPAQQLFKFYILNLVGNVQRFSLTPFPFCVCSDCAKLQRTSLYFGFRWPSERHQRSVGLSAQQQSVLQCCHEHRRGHTYLDSKNIYLYREVGTGGATLICYLEVTKLWKDVFLMVTVGHSHSLGGLTSTICFSS